MADESTPPSRSVPLPLVYANWMAGTAGAADLSLDFGYKGSDEPQPAVRIAMSWEHALLMHRIVGQLLERYREDVGEIRDLSKVTEMRSLELTQEVAEGGDK